MTPTVAAHIKPLQTSWTSTTASAGARSNAAERPDGQQTDQRTAGTMPSGTDTNSRGFMGFLADLIDVINPLQHIPVVGTVYRQLTGDEIGGAARIAGGALFGGPLGGALALADVAYAQENGGYMGDTMLAALTTDTPVQSPPVMLASAADTTSTENLFHHASLSAHPTPNRARTAPSETAIVRVSDTPGTGQPQAEYAAATFRVSGGHHDDTRLTARVASDGSSSLLEAPAESRMDVPPELMAMKMQEALDKYAAMKVRGL